MVNPSPHRFPIPHPFVFHSYYAIILTSMEIGVLIDEEFASNLDAAWLEDVMVKVLAQEKALQGEPSGRAPQNIEVGLVITSQEEIERLNKTYLGEDHPTDVLSFAMGAGETSFAGEVKDTAFVLPNDGLIHLGEVIISYPQAVIQAEEHHHPVKKELAILITHGLLHLLGYDHDELEREKEMHAREAEILKGLEGMLW
jgi:probable rRNA maturation factor